MKGRIGVVVQGLFKNQRGITGLETAIVLIAFVVVSSVFAFAALSTGMFSSDKAREAVTESLGQEDLVVSSSDSPDFPFSFYTTLGNAEVLEPGESVIILIPDEYWKGAQLTWSLDPPSESGTLSSDSGRTITYTAPDRSTEVTVLVEADGDGLKGSVAITFLVMVPEPPLTPQSLP